MTAAIDPLAAGRASGPLERLAGSPGSATPGSPPGARPAGTVSFADELAAAGRDHSVNLSGHAQRRLEQRQIELPDDKLERLGRAIDSLAARGGRQSLVMLDQVAYVVHVASHTVVTAVAPGERKEAVFTQIDSVAIA
jgi:flagellar operon protein